MGKASVSSRRFSRGRIYIVFIAAIALALIIGVGGWLLLSGLSEHVGKGALLQRQTSAQNIAGRVAERLAAYQGSLADLAARPETRGVFFAAADPAVLAALGQRHARRFAGALKLRYILPGNYQPDNASFPPLSYASLDMLRQAETSGDAPAEVHLHGTPAAHVVLLQRVNSAAFAPVGFLHLSLDPTILDALLGSIEQDAGYAELIQPVSGRTIVLAMAGEAAARQGDAILVDIPGARFKVAYWPRDSMISAAIAGSGRWLPYLPGLLVLLAGLGFLALQLKHVWARARAGKMAEVQAAAADTLNETLVSVAEVGAELAPDLDDPESITVIEMAAGKETSTEIDPVIFRAYDIRGIVGKTLTREAMQAITEAIGARAGALGQQRLVVGRDGRKSSPKLAKILIEALCASGRDVIDIGLVPTPLLYFATHHLDTGSGVMLTGSHNGPEYNGLKIMLAGHTLGGEDIKEIQRLSEAGEMTRFRASGGESAVIERRTGADESAGDTAQQAHTAASDPDELLSPKKDLGKAQQTDIAAAYLRRVADDIAPAFGDAQKMKIVVDCGNGAAGVIAPQLLGMLGHEVIELYCDIDGGFPNHHPDPSQPENLRALIDKVQAEGADIGFAFDGDGDRLGVVDSGGRIIWPDRQLMLLAKDVLGRNPGAPIIFDVKCSRHLQSVIEAAGGRALMWKTGHSLIKNKMKEVGAPLAGEMSGHIFFKERWYGFDDALYTAARLIEIFTEAGQKPAEMFRELPEDSATPELRLPLAEAEHDDFMRQLEEKLMQRIALDQQAEAITIDGLRIEYSDGWGLARPSNTSPNIILRFEGKDEAVLQRIQAEFTEAIRAVKPAAKLPFQGSPDP